MIKLSINMYLQQVKFYSCSEEMNKHKPIRMVKYLGSSQSYLHGFFLIHSTVDLQHDVFIENTNLNMNIGS